ncbi:kinesin-like protein KIN-14E [Rutidosis leptorrhynchoides]|uniref:kinesin-like protein KIN-14E n=1 Tax=Rutidosis leptorrhynchoides TaxID=125765 RepID=UPI003A99B2F3
MKGKVRVFCREEKVCSVVDEFRVQIPENKDKKGKSQIHKYAHVFDEKASQEEVFRDTKDLVQSAVDGCNVCLFAYGQSGSGKTYTMYGTNKEPGLTKLASYELFKIQNRESERFDISFKVYMLEWYDDRFVDLLAEDPKKKNAFVHRCKERAAGNDDITMLYLCGANGHH